VRALLCSCRRHLEGADEEELFREVLQHIRREHPMMELSETQLREVVEAHSYRYELVEVYAGGGAALPWEEEFGPEPY
jgi:predicted small metal-binding protein